MNVALVASLIWSVCSVMSALGQTLPNHSALVRINICFPPQATKSRTSRE